MKKIFYRYEVLLLGITLILFIANLTPGLFLVGWDNLQTDLHPTLGIKRAFFSAWQEYQSFGLAAGMGHAADLVRAVFIWLLSLVMPDWLLRYSFHLLMIPVAGLGMLQLLKFSGFSKEKKIYAFLGSLFYVLNFAVIQMLYLPFEPFTVFFAMLPWEIWIFLKILNEEKPAAKHWLLFISVNVLATPQSVAQQLFVVYMLLLFLLGLGLLIKNRSGTLIKRGLTAAILIVILNAFWLMPQVYFLVTNGSVVKESKINQLATSDVFYSNKDKGNPKDFFAFNGFFYDRVDMNQLPLFQPWKQHREMLPLQIVIYTLTVISLCGLLKHSRFRLPFSFCYILIATALLSNTPPFDLVNQFIRTNDFVNQIFRSPFTKFAIPYALVTSYFFTAGLLFLSTHLKHLPKSESVSKILLGAVFSLLVIQSIPAFQGNLFAKSMKVTIPQEYFSAMEYFGGQDKNKRIALLPEYTLWGWFHTSWGYDGSGFLWYGIEQPIISRTFDVWSYPSESYFWEAKTALEAENLRDFENVLDKYAVDYILLDTSLRPITSNIKSLQYDRLKDMLTKSTRIKQEKSWNFLTLYHFERKNKAEDFIRGGSSLPNIGPKVTLTNNDTAYNLNGDYLTTDEKRFDVFYPFLNLTTQTHIPGSNWNITESASVLKFARVLEPSLNSYFIPSSQVNQTVVYNQDTVKQYAMPIAIDKKNNAITVAFPKVRLSEFAPAKATPFYCQRRTGTLDSETEKDALVIRSAGSATGCISFANQQLDQEYGYLVTVTGKRIEGPSLFFYILDLTKDQAYVEDRLTRDTEYYVLAPKYEHGIGYAFTFQNTSYRTVPSENRLDNLSVYLLPFNTLKNLSLTRTSAASFSATTVDPIHAEKRSYYRYEATLPESSGNTYVILDQAHSIGWRAYMVSDTLQSRLLPFLFGTELTSHYLVNNWQNGWLLPDSDAESRIVILYLPQYLQYVGYFLILTIIGVLTAFRLTNKSKNSLSVRYDKEA